MASAAGYPYGNNDSIGGMGIRSFGDLGFANFELWKDSIDDYKAIKMRRHFVGDVIHNVPLAPEQVAAAMRQSLHGAAAKVLLKLTVDQRKDPDDITAALQAACLPNEQAELCSAMEELLSFAQGSEDEMEYLLRFDKAQVMLQKLLRERVVQPDGTIRVVEHDLPPRMWGFILKRGLVDDLARRVVGSLGTLDPDRIRASILGMAGERKKGSQHESGFTAAAADPEVEESGYLSMPKKKPFDKKDIVCFECGRKGHFARECPVRSSPVSVQRGRGRGRRGIGGGRAFDSRPRVPTFYSPQIERRNLYTPNRGGVRGRGRGRGRASGRGPNRRTSFRPRARAYGAYDEYEPEEYEEDEYEDEYEDGDYEDGVADQEEQ